MTTDGDVILIGGVPLHERLTSDPGLPAMIVDRLVRQLPAYGGMPDEELDGDIVRMVETGIRLFVDALRNGRMPDHGDLQVVRESAARRAEEGVPLEVVVSAYHIGVRTCVGVVGESALPCDVASVFHLTETVTDYLRLVTGTVAAGYVEERRMVFGDEHAARHELLSALLDGSSPLAAADRAALRLPTRYLVLGLRIGPHEDEGRSDVDSSVAARRKVRRLRVELERHSGEPVLHALSPDGGVALIADDGTPELSSKDYEWVAMLVSRLGKVAGATVHAGLCAAVPSGVADAAHQARDLATLSRRFGRPPGVYRLADLMLEYQLTRPSPARDAFAALLAPLTSKPELLDTLRTYLANDLSRRHSAAELRVHPNTVDYRIRKVAQLTGLDPTRPMDLPRITAALAALPMRGEAPHH